jgi:phosphoribosyl-ATP pyrophosphohydrolase
MAPPPTDARVLERLFATIQSRRGDDPAHSYTAPLFSEGRPKIARKTGEEAIEVVVAALADSREQLAAESADLLYHLLVLWADADVAPDDVWRELERREGTSGLAEKASRSGK